MDVCKIKKIGTREEVFKGLASRTAGNLQKNDIIEKQFSNRTIYISKKLSDKMKANITILRAHNPNFLKGLQRKTMTSKPIILNIDNIDANNSNTTNNTNTITQSTNLHSNLNSNNKQKPFTKIKNNSTKTQKILFKEKQNSVKTVFYPELQGLNLNKIKEELKQEEAEEDYGTIIPKIKLNTSFTIEEFPDIDNIDFE